MPREIVGAILAGGKSTRLGQDKTRILWEGKPLLARMFSLLRELGLEVWVLGRSPKEYGFECNWLLDEVKNIGPMGGIYTGLKNIKKSLLVVSSDLPYLSTFCLKKLLEERERAQKLMTTFFYPDTGYIESLIAIYEYEALNYIKKALNQKIFKLSAAIPTELRNQIEVREEWKKYFFNLNYPEDLEKLNNGL